MASGFVPPDPLDNRSQVRHAHPLDRRRQRPRRPRRRVARRRGAGDEDRRARDRGAEDVRGAKQVGLSI